MSTLQGESFYFHHGWHFLRADAFPMAKAVDAHRDAEGHAFYEADYQETGWQPVTLPHTFNDEDLFRDRIQDGGSGQRRSAAFFRNTLKRNQHLVVFVQHPHHSGAAQKPQGAACV